MPMAIGRHRKVSLLPRAAAAALALVAGGVALWWLRRSRTAGGRSDGMHENANGSRRMIEEVFGAGRYDVVDELVAESAIGHDPALPAPTRGPQGVKEGARGYRDAFPDLRIEVEEVVAEKNLVALRWSARGTHRGDLFGIAPTGKEATVSGMTIDRWADGKIVESWTNWDTLGLLQQLGAVPAAAATPA
jgi:steroid delta-isomerase-like uncharacterized protein